MSAPVTVSVTRHIDPSRTPEMIAWVRAGASLAERFDGFLGVGWVRPATDSDEWHMLYRFDSAEALATWEQSEQRRWWLDAAQGRIGESRVEKRTGIEGWFDEPTAYDVEDLRPAPTPPPRWKQACVIFLVFYPLSVLANWAAAHTIADWQLPVRVLATVLVMTPVMTYLALPWVTRRMEWWLRPAGLPESAAGAAAGQ